MCPLQMLVRLYSIHKKLRYMKVYKIPILRQSFLSHEKPNM